VPLRRRLLQPQLLLQVRCPVTGYLRTLPFEKSCPLPGAFASDSAWLDGMLKPAIKPKGGAVTASSAKAPEAVGARAAAAKAAKAEKKEAAAAPTTPAADAASPAEAFAKARLAVGRVISASFVDGSDKLYLCQVDVGEDKPRQVITGLRKYVVQEVLATARVVVILNLKPAKLAGHASEAMILAAEIFDSQSGEERQVRLLAAPDGAAPGDRVHLEAGPPAAPPPKECKSAAWATVKALLSVQGGRACFDRLPLVSGAAGHVLADAPDNAPIG